MAAVDRQDVLDALGRHLTGDWGDIGEDARRCNEKALERSGRIISSYMDRNCKRFMVITETDRSTTTILLPGED